MGAAAYVVELREVGQSSILARIFSSVCWKAGSPMAERFVRSASPTPPGTLMELRARSQVYIAVSTTTRNRESTITWYYWARFVTATPFLPDVVDMWCVKSQENFFDAFELGFAQSRSHGIMESTSEPTSFRMDFHGATRQR